VKFFGLSGRRRGPGREVLLTGIPRSGTTLCCQLLDKLPDVVALHEPMDTRRLFDSPDGPKVREIIARFLARSRRDALERGVARTKHVGGKVPDNVMSSEVDEKGERHKITTKGEVTIGKPLTADFTLVVKHNGLFTAVLAEIVDRFEVFGVVRNPLSVLSSWNSVRFGMRTGRSPGTERLAPDLKESLDKLDDVTAQQIHVVNWYCERYTRLLPPERILRYEDVIATRGRALALLAPAAATLNDPMKSRNASKLYDRDTMRHLGERLLADEGAWRGFYTRDDIESVLAGADTETSKSAG